MRTHPSVILALTICGSGYALDDKPLNPESARNHVGKEVTFEMTVRATKDRLEKRKEIYLDSELDFRDAKNFAIVITLAGAQKLKEAGIADPAVHLKDKRIRVKGIVKEDDQKVPCIEVDEPNQLRIVEPQP